MSNESNRRVQEIIARGIEWWDGRRGREVVATYDGGEPRREIELGVRGRWVPQYAAMDEIDEWVPYDPIDKERDKQ